MIGSAVPRFAGDYTDEVTMGLASWLLAKQGGIVGEIGRAGLIVENANVGATLTAGISGKGIGASSGVVMYG